MSEDLQIYKEYRIVPHGSFPMWVVKAKAQGQVPVDLRGMYSTVPDAKKHIDQVDRAKPKTKKKAVKNETDGTS